MDALDKLIAIEEIQQLKARYFRTMDLRDWDGMGETFTRDAVFDYSVGMQITPLGGQPEGPVGAIWRGREAIIAAARAAYAETTSIHHGHCHEVTIDSETEAHGVIASEAWIRAADRTTRLQRSRGHYQESYRFEDGQWRIAVTRVVPLFKGPDV